MTDKPELDLDDVAQAPWRYCEMTQAIYGNSPRGEHYVAMIRGWGHYTGNGHGALGLSTGKAIEIQNSLGQRIAKVPQLEDEITRLKKDKADAIFFASKLEDELTRLKAENTELKERL